MPPVIAPTQPPAAAAAAVPGAQATPSAQATISPPVAAAPAPPAAPAPQRVAASNHPAKPHREAKAHTRHAAKFAAMMRHVTRQHRQPVVHHVATRPLPQPPAVAAMPPMYYPPGPFDRRLVYGGPPHRLYRGWGYGGPYFDYP